MALAQFRNKYRPNADRLRVRLTPKGVIALNRTAYEAIGSPTHLELLYDRERRLIALRAAGRDAKNSFAVSRASEWSPQVRSAYFLSFCGLSLTESITIEDVRLDGDTLLVQLDAARATWDRSRRER